LDLSPPELTSVELGLLGILLILGLVIGWIVRGNRCVKEKMAVNAGWQGQIAAQESEHARLAKQNKSLMAQISENQASHRDSKMRAHELSDSLKEAFDRRDELQRQIKNVRNDLQAALGQRDKLQAEIEGSTAKYSVTSKSIKDKDDKIFYLSRELQSWQDRVPPLVERFRTRDLEAQQVEAELAKAKGRIEELESLAESDQTRIESASGNALAEGLDASNDQYEETAEHAIAEQDDEMAPAELDASTDDLRKIRGIGPAIEKTLHSLGIYRYGQIADLSELDIDRVAQKIRGFRSRIGREDWIEQARSLDRQKNPDPG